VTIDMTTFTGKRNFALSASLAALAAIWTGHAFAQPSAAERFPAGSIRSIAEADAALAEAATDRKRIEARYQAEEQGCHPKFFTTSCIEQAKERRRTAMSALRPVEIEANAFKRQAQAAEKDKALAERLAKEEKDRQERKARTSRPTATGSDADAMPKESSREEQPRLFSDRDEKHEAKLKQKQADDAANAEMRAENIAAYEKKKQDALARQQKVAQRKAEKEKKRQAKHLKGSKSDLEPDRNGL
jgi:colicin import membrane protein